MAQLRCNIDRRGRFARGLSGAICLAFGVAFVLLRLPGDPAWLRWLLAGLLAFLGGFQIFEAWVGWCVTRALGFKTPM